MLQLLPLLTSLCLILLLGIFLSKDDSGSESFPLPSTDLALSPALLSLGCELASAQRPASLGK